MKKLPSSSPDLQEWYYQTTCPWLSEDIPDLDIAQYDFRRNLYGEAISSNHQLWIPTARWDYEFIKILIWLK